MKDRQVSFDKLEIQDIVALMSVYLSEWEHRDELFWKQIFKYFYVTLVTLFLPNLAGFLGIELPDFPQILFPTIAAALSVIFLYVAIGYIKRLEAIGITYREVMNRLPPELRRVSIIDRRIKHGKHFNRPMSVVLCVLMFGGLLILAAIMVVYYLEHPSGIY